MAGVNDCVNVMRDLVHRLVEMRIRPYYLYQCDLVEGSGHFRTPVGKGLEIMEGLRGHTSGYAVPTYVIDAPGGGGKIPVMPNYLISYSDHKVVLRNYEGYITTYEEPPTYERHDESACEYCQHHRPEPGQSGVLGLLEGERMWIEPKGFSEIHTRGATETHRLQDPAKWVPFGVGAIEGQAGRPLRVLDEGRDELGRARAEGRAVADRAGVRAVADGAAGGAVADGDATEAGPAAEAATGEAGPETESAAAGAPPAAKPGPDAADVARRKAASRPAAGRAGRAQRRYGPGEEPRPREGEPTGSAHG